MRIHMGAVRVVAVVAVGMFGIPSSAQAQTDNIGQGNGSFFTYSAGTATYGVNVNTGNLLVVANDVALGGDDADLYYTRAYNGLEAANGAQHLGGGWRDNFDVALVRRDANTYDFIDVTGYAWRFRKQPDGTFRPDDAGFGTLVYSTAASGSPAKWVVTETSSDHRYGFYSATTATGGILDEEIDLDANRLVYSRDRIVGHESDRIQTATGPAGATTFYAAELDGDFRLDHLIDPDSFEAFYTYDAGERVENFETSDAEATGYGYNANGKLSEVVTATGWTLRIAYTSYAGAQRVSAFEATKGAFRFFAGLTYSAPDPALCLPTDVRMTTVTDQDGRVSRFCSTAAWKLTVRSGNVQRNFLDSDPDDPETDDDSVPAGGYGEPEATDLCIPDPESLTDNYCGEDDVGPETEAFYTEPPLIDDTARFGALAAPRFRYGLSDQGLQGIYGNGFWQPLFEDLQVRRARLIVAWDVVPRGRRATRCGPKQTFTLEETDAWVTAARALGQEILVSFNHSRGNETCLPSVSSYYKATKSFRERYPDIKLFTAWNEPMHPDQPTQESPVRAGRFWRNLNWQCKSHCVVAAGDFSDGDFRISNPNVDARDYLRDYKRGAGHSPRIWAWHAYRAGKTRSQFRLRAFLNATNARSKVWITESGAVIHRGERGPGGDLTTAQAASRLEYLLDDLGRGLPRVTRYYLYQWFGNDEWDSGLMDRETFQPRNLYGIFKARTNPPG
jgi:YD repeat-containing protein